MRIVTMLTKFNKERYFQAREIVMDSGRFKLVRKLMWIYVQRVNRKYCSNIYTSLRGGVQFETVPILPHDLCGIFIASTAIIGKKCTILQQVTIGGNPAAYDGSAPISKAATIGDNVIIGAGAKIIGDVKIGNNVRIGANAVVLRDVPDNCTAVGVPARIIYPKDSKLQGGFVNNADSCDYANQTEK